MRLVRLLVILDEKGLEVLFDRLLAVEADDLKGNGGMVMRNCAVARSCFPSSTHSLTISSSRIEHFPFARDLAFESGEVFPFLEILYGLDYDIQREGYLPE